MQSFPLTDPEKPVLLCFFGHEMDARAYTDTELETRFPEHPWREPVRLRLVKDHRGSGWLTCRFCLYRRGLIPFRGLPLFGNPICAEVHIREQHG